MKLTKGWAVVDAKGKVRDVTISRADATLTKIYWEGVTGKTFRLQRVEIREAGR